jgi:hypothetical protein
MQPHPESDLFRCASCTHAFSVPREHETYDEDYYEVAHERWFKHPNTALFDRVADAIHPARRCSKSDAARATSCDTFRPGGRI